MRRYFLIFISIALFLFAFVQALYNRSPLDFPRETFLTIEKGTPLQAIASDFEKRHLVRSAFWLKAFVTLRGGSAGAIAGDYFFKERRQSLGARYRSSARANFLLLPHRKKGICFPTPIIFCRMCRQKP